MNLSLLRRAPPEKGALPLYTPMEYTKMRRPAWSRRHFLAMRVEMKKRKPTAGERMIESARQALAFAGDRRAAEVHRKAVRLLVSQSAEQPVPARRLGFNDGGHCA